MQQHNAQLRDLTLLIQQGHQLTQEGNEKLTVLVQDCRHITELSTKKLEELIEQGKQQIQKDINNLRPLVHQGHELTQQATSRLEHLINQGHELTQADTADLAELIVKGDQLTEQSAQKLGELIEQRYQQVQQGAQSLKALIEQGHILIQDGNEDLLEVAQEIEQQVNKNAKDPEALLEELIQARDEGTEELKQLLIEDSYRTQQTIDRLVKDAHYFNFAVIWDGHHDLRAIDAIEKIYHHGLLPHFVAFGERKGSFTAVLNDLEARRFSWNLESRFSTEALPPEKLREIQQKLGRIVGERLSCRDSWSEEIYSLSNSQDSYICSKELVTRILATDHTYMEKLWGAGEIARYARIGLEEIFYSVVKEERLYSPSL